MNNKKRQAFSLIELSIVILIIGILVAGVTQGSRLVGQMRLATAKSLTQSSPVSSIRNLVTWYETTADKSPDDAVEEDGLVVNNWYDINPQAITKNHATSTVGPTYKASCINGLPCLQFNGSSQILHSTQNLGTTTELTLFVVFYSNVLSCGGVCDIVITKGDWSTNDRSFIYSINNNSPNALYYRSTNSGAANTYTLSGITIKTNYVGHVG